MPQAPKGHIHWKDDKPQAPQDLRTLLLYVHFQHTNQDGCDFYSSFPQAQRERADVVPNQFHSQD